TVQLRANGSFSGAASFTLPEIPRVIIVKTGRPVVSSEEIDGDSWFVQTHEFALFSQQSGTLEIPVFEVRFSHRNGFTGPSHDQTAQVPAVKIKVERPQGSSRDDFLVTTTSLKITESWDPQPEVTEQGAVFRRTITQTADNVTGMALAPPPGTVPKGIRIYLNRPQVTDRTERGDFIGIRSDTITYQMQQPGNWTLPAIRYQWWDPEKKEFGSQTLPAVTFQVKSTSTVKSELPVEKTRTLSYAWWGLLMMLLGIGYWQQRRIRSVLHQLRQRWNPSEKMAARALLSACHKNDPGAAESAWQQWERSQASGQRISEELKTAVQELQRTIYGAGQKADWQGQQLADAFREHLQRNNEVPQKNVQDLPVLNP
ncbi:hypothetical protein, partial [uncultured Gimesia sp.]